MTFEEVIELYISDGILHFCKERLAKIVALPFDRNLHYSLTYIHLHYAILEEAKILLDHITDKNDETYKQLEDYYNALAECQRSNIGIFPLNVPYRNWWNGPHLNFAEKEKITEWFPLRINYITANAVIVFVNKNGLYGQIELPLSKFENPQKNVMGEIAFYGDDFLIKLHTQTRWQQPPEIKAIHLKVLPIIEKSYETLMTSW